MSEYEENVEKFIKKHRLSLENQRVKVNFPGGSICTFFSIYMLRQSAKAACIREARREKNG